MKKGILINVKDETITEVQVGDFRHIQKLVDCDLFEIVGLGGNQDLYVDEEGLLFLNGQSKFFTIEGYPQPLCGNGLVLGSNRNGESVNTKFTVEEIKSKVKYHTLSEVQVMEF